LSIFAKRTKRIVAGTLAGALAMSVTPIMGLVGTASAADALPPLADPIGDGNFCEDAPTTEPFTDVSATDPSLDEIICLVATELTKGTTATTYSPNASITRRQMALFIKRTADLANELDTGTNIAPLPAYDGTEDFADIAGESTEAKEAIGQLVQADIVQGTTATTYSPGANVSRRQMAAFVNRLQEFLTGAPFTTTGDFFDDDTGDTGEANLNAVASVGIFQGDGAGNVNPGDPLTRRQMANVLLRYGQVLFDAGDIARAFAEDDGTTGTVTSTNADPVLFDTADGQSLSADLTDGDTTDTFFIDGVSATSAAFQAATTPGDTILVTDNDADGNWDVFRLTNNPVPQSGLVGAVGIDNSTFSIISAAGTVLDTHTFGDASDTYTVGGAAVSQAGFEAALSLGDTVVTTDTTVPANGDPETYALTNGSWDGTVGTITDTAGVEVTFEADGVGDDPDLGADDTLFSVTAAEVTAGTQSLTIGGAAATFLQFEAAITDGDTVVYSRAAGVETFALTNVAISTSFSGTTDDSTDSTADTIGYISGTVQTTFVYTAVTNYRVNAVVVTKAEFETALDGAGTLPFGEAVSFDEATGVLALTTATSFGPNPFSDVDTTDDGDLVNESIDIDNASGLTYVDLNAETAFDATIARWFVNGVEVTETVYEDYLLDIDADGNQTGDSFQVVLTALATEHRLTTNNTL